MARKEDISVLFDGENIEKSLLDELKDDSSWQEDWKMFALTRDVLREKQSVVQWDIAARVADALDNEPSYEVSQNSSTSIEPPVLQEQPKPDNVKKYQPSWIQQLTQVGMAAGVALAVIVGVQQYQGITELNNVIANQPPVLQTIPLAGKVEPVNFSRESLEGDYDETKIMEQRRRINTMFQDYELQLRLNVDQMDNKKDELK